MTDHVTHEELDEAIQAVHERIDETENTLRREFGHAAHRLEEHLDRQDTRLDQIMLALLAGLFVVIGALIYLAH